MLAEHSFFGMLQVTVKIYPILIAFIVSLVMFMEAVDATVINTAIPVMAQSLQVNPIDLKIALISYLLSLAIFIPISGWMADRYGMKRVFIAAIVVFTLSSIACGFAKNLPELVMMRALQGLGGSLTMPVGRLILLRTFPRHEMIGVMNRVIMVASIGLMLGPMLGGFITHYFSWRWIFWVNVPVGIFTVLMAIVFIPAIARIKMPKLDKIGFVLFGGSLALFTFGLSAFSETYVPDSTALFIMIAASLLFFIYALHSRKKAHPIVKTELFQARTFRISVLGNLLSRLGFGGVPFLLPLLLQISFGFSPQVSGLLLAPTAIGVLLIKFFTIPLLRHLGYKKVLLINTTMVVLSLWGFTQVDATTALIWIALLTFLYGFFISMQYSSMNSLAYAGLSAENLGAATSIMSTLQQLSQSFGVAVAALLLRIFSAGSSQKFLLTAKTFHQTFFALGVLTLFSAIVFLFLKPGDGNQMIRSEKKLEEKT